MEILVATDMDTKNEIYFDNEDFTLSSKKDDWVIYLGEQSNGFEDLKEEKQREFIAISNNEENVEWYLKK